MIKHEEIVKTVKTIKAFNTSKLTKRAIKILETYVVEQEKKDELLELYREYHNLNIVYQHQKRLLRFKNKENHKDEYSQLYDMEILLSITSQQIKALEEEMK